MAGAAQAALLGAFGDQAFTLPDELGGGGVDFFGDATDKDVVAVGHVAAVWQGDAEQSVLAVVAVIAGEALACAASFLSEVAVGVVSVVAPVQRFTVEAAAAWCSFGSAQVRLALSATLTFTARWFTTTITTSAIPACTN